MIVDMQKRTHAAVYQREVMTGAVSFPMLRRRLCQRGDNALCKSAQLWFTELQVFAHGISRSARISYLNRILSLKYAA